ncbi:MAG: hypothetical protein AAF562_10780 [Pseudomonadota bacterium]
MAFDVEGALARALAAVDTDTGPLPTAKTAKLAKETPRLASLARLATTQGSDPEFENAKQSDVPIVMDRFYEKAAMLEYDERLPRDTATWLAALAVFVPPLERKDCFDNADNLLPIYRQLSVAVGEGIVVTFHENGRISFHGKAEEIDFKNTGAGKT